MKFLKCKVSKEEYCQQNQAKFLLHLVYGLVNELIGSF